MESSAIRYWLGRLLSGACLPGDVLPLARQAGFPSFADLCSAALPERLPRLALDHSVIAAHVRRGLAGELPFPELRSWADELHAIAFRHVIGKNRAARRRAVEALALVAMAADSSLFKTREPCALVLSDLARALEEGSPVVPAALYSRLFVGQEELHLAARRPLLLDSAEEETPETAWADVVLREEPGKASRDDASAVVAFALVTESAAEGGEEGPSAGAPVIGALTEAKRRAPNFAFARFRPRILRDVDGILEIVLRTQEIGREELVYGAKLFAILNGVGSVTLDGERVPTLRF